MANNNNMYGANLKEYALEVLRNKQVADGQAPEIYL
jgi:hypothetical protein